MASVSDLQARRDATNNTRAMFNSEGVYEAAEDNSSQIILETPDPDIVKTISRYFEAALSREEYVLSHPVTDHGNESSADSDSGDSLFITQVPVSEVVRSVRRCHSKERSEFTCTIESEEERGEEDGPATPQRKQQVSPTMKHHKRKTEKHGLEKYSFPFLGSVYRSQHLSSRERAYRNTHLPLLKSVTFASKAIGGFFRCVKTLKKFSKGKATLASALPNRYLDEEGELSPLSEQEEESEGSDDDIRVVEKELLMPFLKRKNSQTWCYRSSETEKQCRKFSSVSKNSTTKTKKHLPHVKQTLSLVSKTIKDTTSKRSVAGARQIVPEKCNITEEETNPESVGCIRRCSSGSLVRNETDAEEPGIHFADNTDGQQENDNMDISLTEWKTMLNIGFVSEEGERSRIDQAVDITSSPINEVQERDGSCLERTQVDRAMTPIGTRPRPDRDHQNQTRETEADPGIKGHITPSTDPEHTNDCPNVDAGGDAEQKGKKRKKKNRKRERDDDESIEDRVEQLPCQEAPDDQELVTCVRTGTIQGGEATEITQGNKAEHSVSMSGEMIMPPRKKRKMKRRRESPCHADTDIGLGQEENTKLSSHPGGDAIVQTDDMKLKKIKKKKKNKNSTAHAILEEGSENLSLESQLDEVIGPQKGTNISTLPQDTVRNLQVTTTEIRQKTIECSIVQLTELVSQRKKHKTMAPIENSLTQSDGTVSFKKKKKAQKDGDSFCNNAMAGNYTEIPLTTSTLSQSGKIDTLEKKKRKQDKKQNSDTHEDSEAKPKENVETHERSEYMITEKKRKKKKKKRSKSSTDEGAIVQQQEDNTKEFHVTLKSSVSESIDIVPPRKKKKKYKDSDLVMPLSAEESHEKDNMSPETDEIVSPRKIKRIKRDRCKDTCSVIHKDTAAPLEEESFDISLEGCESYDLTPGDMVSQRISNKNKNSQHDPSERLKNDATKISQRMSAAVKNSRPDKKIEIGTTEVRIEAESAFISSDRKRKKTKRRKSTDNEVPEVGHQDNDNTAVLIETTQSYMTQYIEKESQKKKKKKKKKKKNIKTDKESVAPEDTDGRQAGEMMSEATSDCLPLPQINPDPVSNYHELVSSAEKKKKKKKHGKDKRMMDV